MVNENDKADEKLITSFYTSIIPLLQEYFFGDYGKIGLILGEGFIRKKEWNKNGSSFADFETGSDVDFEDKDVYEFIDYRNLIEPYRIKLRKKGENETEVEMNFQKAIKLLMKQDFEQK
jgi:5-methylcytosine-specific restriction protein B